MSLPCPAESSRLVVLELPALDAAWLQQQGGRRHTVATHALAVVDLHRPGRRFVSDGPSSRVSVELPQSLSLQLIRLGAGRHAVVAQAIARARLQQSFGSSGTRSCP